MPHITIPGLAFALAPDKENEAGRHEPAIERAVEALCEERLYFRRANIEWLVGPRLAETVAYLIDNCEDRRLRFALAAAAARPLVPLERFERHAELLRRAFRAWAEQAHTAGDLRGVEADLHRAAAEASLVPGKGLEYRPFLGDTRGNRRAAGAQPWPRKPRKRKTARRVAPQAIRADGLLMKTAEMVARDLGYALSDLIGPGKPGRQSAEAKRRLVAQRELVRALHRQGKSQAVISKLLELHRRDVHRFIGSK